jgi:ketosteroid isomerase-like protein
VGDDLVEFVRSMYAPWERADFGDADWADPEIEFVLADGPTPGRWFGADAMAKGWAEMLSAWEGLAVEVEDIVVLDDERVLVLMHNRGRGKLSGVDIEQIASRGANLVQVRDGKVVKLVAYFDRERAFEELDIDPASLGRGR